MIETRKLGFLVWCAAIRFEGGSVDGFTAFSSAGAARKARRYLRRYGA